MKLIVAPHAEEVLKLEAQLWAETNTRLAAELLEQRFQDIANPDHLEAKRAAFHRYVGEQIELHLLQVRALQRAAWLTTIEAC